MGSSPPVPQSHPPAILPVTPSYKERILGAYENRIRELSAPEKIFEYFASVKRGSGAEKEWFMTPADFIRSITPYNYKGGATVGPHLSKSWDEVTTTSLSTLLAAVDQNGDGLISFSEFIFFSTLLSIPPKYIRVAFEVFDTDGSGTLSADEFKGVMRLLRQANPLAQAQRSDSDSIDAAGLSPHFFGEDGQTELSYDQFHEFLTSLRAAVLLVQFNDLASPHDGKISARDFAMNLASYGDSRQMPHLLPRVEALESNLIRISFEEYRDFNMVLESLEEIQFALKAFGSMGKPFSRQQFHRAARAVANVELTEAVVDVVFFLFDDDGDGHLNDEEFLGVLEGRQTFGVSKPRDTGFIRFASCLTRCATEESYAQVQSPA